MITTKQAAKILGVSRPLVYRLINQGRLKAQQFGRDLLLNESDVRAFASKPRPNGRPRKEQS